MLVENETQCCSNVDILAVITASLHLRLAYSCYAGFLILLRIGPCCFRCRDRCTTSASSFLAIGTDIFYSLSFARVSPLELFAGRILPGILKMLRAGVSHINGSPLNRVTGPAVGRTSVECTMVIKASACRVQLYQLIAHISVRFQDRLRQMLWKQNVSMKKLSEWEESGYPSLALKPHLPAAAQPPASPANEAVQ